MKLALSLLVLFTSIGLTKPVGVPYDFVLGLRSNEGQVDDYARENNIRVLESVAQEFGNHNTFVRFKQTVTGKRIKIILPPALNGNSLMEALIKVRTAYTNGASRIDVAMNAPESVLRVTIKDNLLVSLNWPQLFSIAGADAVKIGMSEGPSKTTTPRRSFKKRKLLGTQFILTGDSHASLTQSLAEQLGLSVLPISEIENLSGGKGFKDLQAFFVSAVSENVNDNIFETIKHIRKLKNEGATVHLIASNLPYARSDKVDQIGVTVTGRLVADLLESSGLDSITFVRAHAPQAQGFFERPQMQVSGRKTINTYLKKIGAEMIIAPDSGAQKDDTYYAEELGLNLGVINKSRDPITSQIRIVGFSSHESVSGKTVVIIDDETSTGKTLHQAAEYLKSLGASRVIAVVTHLTGSADAALSSSFIDEVVVTDTLPIKISHPKLVVLSIAEELAAALSPWLGSSKFECRSLFQ